MGLLLGALSTGVSLGDETESPEAYVDACITSSGTPVVRTELPDEPHAIQVDPANGIGLELRQASAQPFPSFIDSNSPAFWGDGMLHLFNSMGYQTYRTSGPLLAALDTSVEVALPQPELPGNVWLEAVWYDDAESVLYGWYHFEPATLPCLTAPAIGAAVSYDHGLSWEDRGLVIENPNDIDCEYDNGYFTGGSGDFSVILAPDRSYFYFFFSTYAGPLEEQGVAIARSGFEDRGQPGTLSNYYLGDWAEPGIGGRATPLFASSTGWRGPEVEAFWGPSIHWNAYIQRFVMLLNRAGGFGWQQEGVYITFSENLESWSQPEKLVHGGGWYPQVIGLAEAETDSLAGQTMRFYQGGLSCYELEFSWPPVSEPAASEPAMPEDPPVSGSGDPFGPTSPIP
jgi:hypothetical protein